MFIFIDIVNFTRYCLFHQRLFISLPFVCLMAVPDVGQSGAGNEQLDGVEPWGQGGQGDDHRRVCVRPDLSGTPPQRHTVQSGGVVTERRTANRHRRPTCKGQRGVNGKAKANDQRVRRTKRSSIWYVRACVRACVHACVCGLVWMSVDLPSMRPVVLLREVTTAVSDAS